MNQALQREARLRKKPVSSAPDLAAREWLKRSGADAAGDAAQRKLHAAAENCLGTLASGNSHRAETARKTMRRRLRRQEGQNSPPKLPLGKSWLYGPHDWLIWAATGAP
jgi:hypothetical protein